MQDFKNFKRRFRLFISLLALTIFISSCRTTRQLPVLEIKPMTAFKIYKKIDRESPVYNNYESKKISINFDIKNEKNSLSGQFKTKRNKCIILTIRKLSVPIGRGLITPDSVVFVNFFDKSYLADNFSEIKNKLGIDLDFNLIQAILTADISKLLQSENFDKDDISVIDSQMYRIDSRFDPKIDRALSTGNEKLLNRYMKKMSSSDFINYSIWVDPQSFFIRKISLIDVESEEKITIRYDHYELVGRSVFPQEVSFDFFSPKNKFFILLKLSKSSVNTDNDFSFSIPEKFEKLK
jgi:hypothetical protein